PTQNSSVHLIAPPSSFHHVSFPPISSASPTRLLLIAYIASTPLTPRYTYRPESPSASLRFVTILPSPPPRVPGAHAPVPPATSSASCQADHLRRLCRRPGPSI
ncbi:uncharacterized protein BKA78DRAFT_278498, partial [Phyllosticta capitalensis]|uniref:uncharacterized protein n=1 Tax=Phyllosticta capitalensis TaxID=121624 RepID=UPI00312E0CDB